MAIANRLDVWRISRLPFWAQKHDSSDFKKRDVPVVLFLCSALPLPIAIGADRYHYHHCIMFGWPSNLFSSIFPVTQPNIFASCFSREISILDSRSSLMTFERWCFGPVHDTSHEPRTKLHLLLLSPMSQKHPQDSDL